VQVNSFGRTLKHFLPGKRLAKLQWKIRPRWSKTILRLRPRIPHPLKNKGIGGIHLFKSVQKGRGKYAWKSERIFQRPERFVLCFNMAVSYTGRSTRSIERNMICWCSPVFTISWISQERLSVTKKSDHGQPFTLENRTPLFIYFPDLGGTVGGYKLGDYQTTHKT